MAALRRLALIGAVAAVVQPGAPLPLVAALLTLWAAAWILPPAPARRRGR